MYTREARRYYPSVKDLTDDEESEEGKEKASRKMRKTKLKQKLAPGVPTNRRKSGLPKKRQNPVDTLGILSYFRL